MKIADLFRRLSYGELSNLALSGEGSGTIVEVKQPQIVQYANKGLLKLYSRFCLKEKELILEQVEGVTHYHLRRQYAETAGARTIPHRYIKDLPDAPFMGDAIKILKVFNRAGEELPLNDQDNPASLFTPQPDTLQVPYPVDQEPLAVSYQARHPELDDRAGHIMGQIIDVPFFMEDLLLSFIGYQVYCHMNGQENIIKGQEYLAAYEAACLEIEQRDLANQTSSTSHAKLEERGFV